MIRVVHCSLAFATTLVLGACGGGNILIDGNGSDPLSISGAAYYLTNSGTGFGIIDGTWPSSSGEITLGEIAIDGGTTVSVSDANYTITTGPLDDTTYEYVKNYSLSYTDPTSTTSYALTGFVGELTPVEQMPSSLLTDAVTYNGRARVDGHFTGGTYEQNGQTSLSLAGISFSIAGFSRIDVSFSSSSLNVTLSRFSAVSHDPNVHDVIENPISIMYFRNIAILGTSNTFGTRAEVFTPSYNAGIAGATLNSSNNVRGRFYGTETRSIGGSMVTIPDEVAGIFTATGSEGWISGIFMAD